MPAHGGRRINQAVLLRLRSGFVRLLRLNASPHGIALGFSLGLGLSLIPIPFAGMVLALFLAPLVGASLPATYAGTAVVNPLTGAAIYFAELWLGSKLLGAEFPSWSAVREFDGQAWWALFMTLLPAFLLGALTCMLAAVALSYPLLRSIVTRYKRRRGTLELDASTPLARAADGHQHAQREQHGHDVRPAVGEEGQRQPSVGEEFQDHANVEHGVPQEHGADPHA